ncbi:MAG: branched-chain amino acid aminotransferase [Alphaproteobacteria bacterium]|nr:branched-chain amino acid aminotransferase [Alphaproteobacteria bacterium]
MSLVPFDDRDGWIWMDGKLVPWRDAKVHVLTHALHYGSAVFEGERAYGGTIFKAKEHGERLARSAEILGFQLPYTPAQLDKAAAETIAANKIIDGYVRRIAWRGSEVMGVSAQQSKIHVAIATWLWPSYFPMEQRLKGIRLTIAKYRRPSPDTIPCMSKAIGLYMICTISKHEAENQGFADALMFDYRGYVAEATGANVFFVKDGKLHTPKPDCFLDGVTRQTVIALAKKRGIEVVERHIRSEELVTFEECFLCGTAAEVTPVAEVAGKMFTVGQITRQMLADYDALTRSNAKVAA